MVQYFSQTHCSSGLSQIEHRTGPCIAKPPRKLYLTEPFTGKADIDGLQRTIYSRSFASAYFCRVRGLL
jgi:hypothetical protein